MISNDQRAERGRRTLEFYIETYVEHHGLTKHDRGDRAAGRADLIADLLHDSNRDGGGSSGLETLEAGLAHYNDETEEGL